jgi:diacylglycerol kinase (ATP)
LAFEAAHQGYPLIVAVGGDGTFSEVANGVLAAGEDGPTVGLINVGTGGDFRRSLGMGPGFESCLAALASGRERAIDVGRATFRGVDGSQVEQFFVNVLSAGLGGLVDRYIETMPALLGGRAGYYLAALRAVIVSKERPVLARITWHDEAHEQIIPAYLVAICNGRWFGGGMDVAPMALPDDGRLEVVTITAPSKPYLADRVRGVYTGRHLQEPTVHHFPCHRIELHIEDETAERRFLLDVDGEALGSLPLSVEVLPKRLSMRA